MCCTLISIHKLIFPCTHLTHSCEFPFAVIRPWVVHSKKYFLNLSVLTVGNPARNPARPRMRYTLFDRFKHNWSCLLEDFLPQDPLAPFFIFHLPVNNKQAIFLFLSFPSHLILILLCLSWNHVVFILVCVKKDKQTNKKNPKLNKLCMWKYISELKDPTVSELINGTQNRVSMGHI